MKYNAIGRLARWRVERDHNDCGHPASDLADAEIFHVPATRGEPSASVTDTSPSKGDGRIAARMKSLARVDLLILDNWGLEPLDGNARHHLLEIFEDRYGRRSTLVTSQLPVARWFDLIGDPTYADAILDSFTTLTGSNSALSGESMRRSIISAAA